MKFQLNGASYVHLVTLPQGKSHPHPFERGAGFETGCEVKDC